jgi:fatty acid desaturase
VDAARTIARTLRASLKNIATFSMFYHLEHHLFPRVPTCKLNVLAQRIDRHIDPEELKYVF